METKEKANGAVQGTASKAKEAAKTTKTENRPSIPGKEKHDEPVKDQKPAETAQTENVQEATVKAVSATDQTHQPANPEQPQQQEVKTEEEKIKYIKPVLNLEQTIKTVDDLHRKTIQRLALISRIKTLEAFEVKLIEENDELNDNPFQGCKLIIEDDKRRQFVTTTPGLIRLVTQFIFDACHEKLANIEAEIVFPTA